MVKRLNLPVDDRKNLTNLSVGETVYLSGTIYSARDAAHKRMNDELDKSCNSRELPINLEEATIYYMGPSPARPGKVIGSAGPTTASRMDAYTPPLLDLGLQAMIGKGRRSKEVIEAIKKNKAVYFVAVGGAGALLSQSIIASEVIAYDDLGAEAIRKLIVKDFPVIVAIDSKGNNLYEQIL